jgi:hypothetical protein
MKEDQASWEADHWPAKKTNNNYVKFVTQHLAKSWQTYNFDLTNQQQNEAKHE